MQKLLVLTLSLWLCSFSESRSNNPAREGLKWLSLKEASTKVKAENKLILIDLYTDWCSWCKVMDKNTYTNKELIKYVNEKFYAVKLNAETRETISWLGKDFTYDDRYKVNTYALYLTQGQLAFPTTVIIPARLGSAGHSWLFKAPGNGTNPEIFRRKQVWEAAFPGFSELLQSQLVTK
jgi:thioredoxin-related protein